MARLLVLSRSMALALRLADAHEVVEEPIEHLETFLPDGSIEAVVLDVGEPSSAIRTLDRLRAVAITVPLLIVSGYQPSWAALTALDVPAVVVVPLPITRAALLDGIRQLLGESQPSGTSPHGDVPSAAVTGREAGRRAPAARHIGSWPLSPTIAGEPSLPDSRPAPSFGPNTNGVPAIDTAPIARPPRLSELDFNVDDGEHDTVVAQQPSVPRVTPATWDTRVPAGAESSTSTRPVFVADDPADLFRSALDREHPPAPDPTADPAPAEISYGADGRSGWTAEDFDWWQDLEDADAAARAQAEAETEPDVEPEADVEPEPEAETEADVEPEAEPEADVEPMQAELDDEVEAEVLTRFPTMDLLPPLSTTPEPETEAKPEPEPEQVSPEAVLARRRTLLGKSEQAEGDPSELLRRLGGRSYQSTLGPGGSSAELVALAHGNPAPDPMEPAEQAAPIEPQEPGEPAQAAPPIDTPAEPAPQRAVADLVSELAARFGELYGVTDTAQVLADEVIEQAHADAAAILVPDGAFWRVSGGVGLRPSERRLVLEASHWLIAEVAVAGRALMIEDTGVVRKRLEGAPLAQWRHLLALPVAGAGAIVLLARSQQSGRFTEPEVRDIVGPVREASELLRAGLETRHLARLLSGLRESDPPGYST